VHIGNGKPLSIAHKGSSVLKNGATTLKLNNVLHVPEIAKNLISVSQLTLDNKVSVEFSPHCCFIKDLETRQTLLIGTLHNGLYKLNLQSVNKHEVYQVSSSTPAVWHNRLSHCSSTVQDQLVKNQLISITQTRNKAPFSCSYCCRAKAHKIPFFASQTTATVPL
jgi:GAG-pre-integrase domain